MIILKEMARFNDGIDLDFSPSSKFHNKNHYSMVCIYGLYNTNTKNYIDVAFANVVDAKTCNCAIWAIELYTANYIATRFDLSVLQETLKPEYEVMILPYKGTKLTSIAETLWYTEYPLYLKVDYDPTTFNLTHKTVSRIDNTIEESKVKDISHEDILKLDRRFLNCVSYTEGFYVEKDSLITTYLKVDYNELIQGEQMLLLSNDLERFCEDLCHHIGGDATAISEYGFKIKCKNSYFVVNQYESSCDSENIYFEITYSKHPNLREVIRNHDSFNNIKDAISRLLNNEPY